MKLIIFFLLFFSFSTALVSNGQQVLTQPILRIETGMHIGDIRDISADATGNYLITASDDKTVRVWELSSGKFLSVLRPQIGEGHEGKTHAVDVPKKL